MSYNDMSSAELKKLAQDRKIPGYSTKNKAALVDLLDEYDAQQQPPVKSVYRDPVPEERIMVGASNPEEAKEQEELLKDLDPEYTGEVNELGEPLARPLPQGSGPNGEVLNSDINEFRYMHPEQEGYDNKITPDRLFGMKGVLYTDGISDSREHAPGHNIMRAYRMGDMRVVAPSREWRNQHSRYYDSVDQSEMTPENEPRISNVFVS